MAKSSTSQHDLLAKYVNDHLVGAALAIELLEYLAQKFAGTRAATAAAGIYDDVVSDRKELESPMAKLNIAQSTTRKATAWISEKFARAKLALDDSKGGTFQQFEALELISLGVEGKKTLWITLATIQKSVSELRDIDFERLIHRAEDQRSRVESARLAAAGATFAD